MGQTPAVKASEVTVGMRRVYNYGHTYTVKAVETKGGFLVFTIESKDGKSYTEKKRPNTLCAIIPER